MSRRIPGSERTREGLRDLIEGRLSSQTGRSELVRLATRLIIEEGLESEVRDTLGRDYYEHGQVAGQGYRNGVREGRLKTAEGFIGYSAPQVSGTAEPFGSELRGHLKGHSEALEDLAVEMLARGLSVAVGPWRPHLWPSIFSEESILRCPCQRYKPIGRGPTREKLRILHSKFFFQSTVERVQQVLMAIAC